MSADLQLHVLCGSWEDWDALRSFEGTVEDMPVTYEQLTDNWSSDHMWVGQVSWMKAWLDDDTRSWIPDAVRQIYNLFWDAPIVTEGLIKDTLAALNWPDRSHYGRQLYLTDPVAVSANWAFSYRGKRRIRVGRHRMLALRSRGVNRDRRAVKKFLYAHLGQRLIPLSV